MTFSLLALALGVWAFIAVASIIAAVLSAILLLSREFRKTAMCILAVFGAVGIAGMYILRDMSTRIADILHLEPTSIYTTSIICGTMAVLASIAVLLYRLHRASK